MQLNQTFSQTSMVVALFGLLSSPNTFSVGAFPRIQGNMIKCDEFHGNVLKLNALYL